MLGDTSAGVSDLTAGEIDTGLDGADDDDVSTKTVAGSDNSIHTQCSHGRRSREDGGQVPRIWSGGG